MRAFMDELDVVPAARVAPKSSWQKSCHCKTTRERTARVARALPRIKEPKINHATARNTSRCWSIYRGGPQRKITLGEGSALLRKTVRGLLDDKRTHIVLNLADVDCIDSSGIGELVSAYTTAKGRGGDLKLIHLTKKVHDLLQLTKLYTVFDVYTEESAALNSFQQSA